MGIRSFAAELLLPAVLQAKHRNTAPAAGAKDEVATFAALQDKLGYLSKAEVKQIREAYKFADGAHLGQFRASGEPYITHPLAVAGLVADWRLDAQALMAALMHDAMEDCGITKVELIEKFGAPTAELVDGLTKIPNRFQLVLAATYRARMLSQGHAPKIESKNKPGVTALREIAAGEVGIEMLRRVPL